MAARFWWRLRSTQPKSMGRRFLQHTYAISPSENAPKKLTAAWLRSLSPPVTGSSAKISMRRSPVGTRKRNDSLATALVRSSASRSRFSYRLTATMKSWELSNGYAKASASFVTRRYTFERTGPRSTFRWQFRQSKMRAGRLSVPQKLCVT